MEKEKLITLEDEHSNKVECQIIDAFYSKETKQSYLIFTDGTKDQEEKEKLYASRYEIEDDLVKLKPIKDEKEWDIIDKYIEQNIE